MGPPKLESETSKESLRDHLLELWTIVSAPQAKTSLGRFAAGILLAVALNAVFQIRLNDWQGSIYDAIGKKDPAIFLHEIVAFLVIVAVLLCLGVAQTWLQEMLKVRLRQAVTYDLLDEWLKPRRAFWLKQIDGIGVNPDQRIQDDVKRLSELSIDLGAGLLQSSVLLAAFLGVLWQLSRLVVFSIHGSAFTIPGYMVWAALAYSVLGSAATLLVGQPLVRAHAELRAKEADFRFALVRVSESADEIALLRGEARERSLLNGPIATLLATQRHIANRLAGLNWVTGTYGWLAILAPLLLAAPGYFGGSLSLGGLMMVVGAFYQVQAALRWFVDKFPAIAEWRALLARIGLYREALEGLASSDGGASAIAYEAGASSISIENLCVSRNGDVQLKGLNLKVAPGERVLIEATPKSGKSTVHKALAGLWRKGSGVIRMPAAGGTLFSTQPPYLPMGSLRSALTYPASPEAFSDGDIRSVLDRVGLGRFAPSLDAGKRWDRELSLEDRRRLALGRMLLHRPEWVIQDESIYEFEEESRKLAFSILASELAHTAVLSIGRRHLEGTFYQRVLPLAPLSRSPSLPVCSVETKA
jgi:vitamin B12/bleomycin/antimicrobial peptide transport system ATP-binding/permease protein